MATNLASMEARVGAMLFDSTYRIYSTTTIDEGLRQALAELNNRLVTPVTIDDLDSAASTTLSPLHEGVIVIGASGFCARMRVLVHADSLAPAGAAVTQDKLDACSKEQLAMFYSILNQLYPPDLSQKESAEVARLEAQADLYNSQSTAYAGKSNAEVDRLEAQTSLLQAQSGTEVSKTSARTTSANAQAAEVARKVALDAANDADKEAEAARGVSLRGASVPPYSITQAWPLDENDTAAPTTPAVDPEDPPPADP
jgi:hypothetical protein